MKTWFKILGLLILFYGSFFVIDIVTGFIHAATGYSLVNLVLIHDVVVFLLLVVFVIWRRRRLTESTYFEKPKASVLFISIPLAVSLNLFLLFFMPLIMPEEMNDLQELFSVFNNEPLWKTIFILCVFAALNEELLCRGLTYHELRRKMPVTLAVILQGTLFGLYHLNIAQIAYAVPVGILLGYIYVWTRSIWVTMSIHFFNNLSSIIIPKYIMPEAQGNALYSGCFLILAILFTIWLYRLQFGNKTNNELTKAPETEVSQNAS